MITCVLTLGTLNLLLGFFLAIKFELPPLQAASMNQDWQPEVAAATMSVATPETHWPDEPSIAEVVEEEVAARLEPASGEPLVTIPSEWVAVLDEEDIQANSFVEAAMQVLRLQVDKYREELVHLECHLHDKRLDDSVLASILAKQKEVNQAWLEQQQTALDHLAQRRDELAEYYELGEQLEQVLSDQAEQIQVAETQADEIDSPTVGAHLDPAKETISGLIHLAHQLRDCMQQSLIVILRKEDRLDAFDRKVQFDSLTGFHNLHGLEALFREWWRDDPNRQKQLSVGLVDLDDFGELNLGFGARVGDEVIVKFSELLSELNERGAAIARFAGTTFCFFFGDCGSQKATSEVEQVRQSLAATTFSVEGREVQLTASCGVSEVMPDDQIDWVFKRLSKAVAHAQRSDGNRTYKSVGDDLSPTNPPHFRVDDRTIRVR